MTGTCLRTRHAAGRRDDGITLIEQIVTMLVLGLLLSLVTTLIIATQRQTSTASLRLDDIDQARTAVDQLSRSIRTAVEPAQLNLQCSACTGPASQSTAVVAARTDSIQLFANSGSTAGPLLVSFVVTYDSVKGRAVLTKTVQPADPGSAPNYTYTACTPGPSCGTSSLTLVRGVVWPLTRPLFQYYDNSGVELVPTTSQSLTAAQLLGVNEIAIRLPVRTPNALLTSSTTVNSLVALPNAGTGILASPTPFPTP
jgi:type II secretory pathway pseudopilin PulG